MRLIVTLVILSLVSGSGWSDAEPRVRAAEAASTPATVAPVEPQTADSSVGDTLTPLLVSLVSPHAAAVRGSDGQYHVVYELVLANTTSGSVDLQSLTVLDGATGDEVFGLAG